MAKMSILFDGFHDIAYRIEEANGELRPAVNEALEKTQEFIQINLTKASEPYASKGLKGYATGKMFNSILNYDSIEWEGTVASVRVGFDLTTAGGYHSIFIMYGTPRIQKDTKIYNAIKGRTTKKNILQIQNAIMMKYLNLAGKGDQYVKSERIADINTYR